MNLVSRVMRFALDGFDPVRRVEQERLRLSPKRPPFDWRGVVETVKYHREALGFIYPMDFVNRVVVAIPIDADRAIGMDIIEAMFTAAETYERRANDEAAVWSMA